jgi:hypothetical protein
MADSISSALDTQLLSIVEQLESILASKPADYPMVTAGMKTELETLYTAFGDKLAAYTAA